MTVTMLIDSDVISKVVGKGFLYFVKSLPSFTIAFIVTCIMTRGVTSATSLSIASPIFVANFTGF